MDPGRFLKTLAAACLVCVAMTMTTPAGVAPAAAAPIAATAEEGDEPVVPLTELPGRLLARWRLSQFEDGRYRRASGSAVWGGYGNSAIAYAMLLEAANGGDDRYFASSMQAYSWLVSNRIRYQGVFFRLFVTAGYNLARERFGSRPEFSAIKRAWALRLRRFKWDRGPIGDSYRYNKNVVEAVEVIELWRSGLRSSSRGAILGDRDGAYSRALRLLRVVIPRRVAEYSVEVGPNEGWARRVPVADFSDPPDNPPAYDSLTAAMYARAYALLPPARRTAAMRDTARRLLRGVISRTAPDGDIAFAGRSQEEGWALTHGTYAAWELAPLVAKADRPVALSFALRLLSRFRDAHVSDAAPDGAFLTPAQRCCDTSDRPPGQDRYFDVAAYSGLTALTLGWAIATKPEDWREGAARLPTDNFSTYAFPIGRGRFLQHRGKDVYWMLRGQGDFADARADMGVAVMKSRREDGSWADVIPPRPYSGGHHKPADPASPCLAFGRRHAHCAYLELHAGRAVGEPVTGRVRYDAVWRTSRRTTVHRGTAWAEPTPRGLRLTWSAPPGALFKLDHFLPAARCNERGVAGPGLLVEISGQTDCRVVAKDYAGGSRVDLDRIRAVIEPGSGLVTVEYTATGATAAAGPSL